MYGLRRFGIKLGLSTIRGILRGLGNPQDRFRCVHIAGTNGKGSVASALSAIFHAAGYRTGLFTSPHLVRFNERIQVNGREIANPDVVAAYRAVRDVGSGDREATFFEFSTAMALYEFGRRNVDWAIIETGMGGRLDATNVLRPELSIITNISLEHKAYLGTTITAIAGEKAGIIKPNRPVITGVRQPAAFSLISETAVEKSAPLFRQGRDFRVRRNRRKGTFSYFGIDNTWNHMRIGLRGNFQVDNAAMVLAGCEVLMGRGADLPVSAIRKGLSQNRWPGRLEVIGENPLILLDGAHNLMAARHLARFMRETLSGRKVTLVIGILDDKPFDRILADLVPLASRTILTRPKIDRALPPETLLPAARRHGNRIEIARNVESAIRRATGDAAPGDAVVIAGSLYVVGEAKEYFESAARGLPPVEGAGFRV
jgi:dihydrofolate synthase / folylpolyglutamate synthase